jgi:hypothetical protein
VSSASEVAAGLIPEDVLGSDPLRCAVEPGGQVAGDPEVARIGAVGSQVDPRGDLAHRTFEDAGGAQLVEQPGQGLFDERDRRGRLEQPEPREGLEWRAAGRGAQARRRLVAGEGRVRRRTE